MLLSILLQIFSICPQLTFEVVRGLGFGKVCDVSKAVRIPLNSHNNASRGSGTLTQLG